MQSSVLGELEELLLHTINWLQWAMWVLALVGFACVLRIRQRQNTHRPTTETAKTGSQGEQGEQADRDEQGEGALLVVIAHPDDEAMFFTPCLRELSTQRPLHVLCLSTGDFAGLGQVRYSLPTVR
jgi:GlcNAc-PI de-N-acetylase